MGVVLQPRGITVVSTLDRGNGYPQAQHVMFEGQALDLPTDSASIALQPDGGGELRVIAGLLATITALVPRGDGLPASLRFTGVGMWNGDGCRLLSDIDNGAIAVSTSLVVLSGPYRGHPGPSDASRPSGDGTEVIGVMSAEYALGQQETPRGDIIVIPRNPESQDTLCATLVVEDMPVAGKTMREIGNLALKPPPDVQEHDAVVGFLLVDPTDLCTSIVAHNGLNLQMPTALFMTTAVGPSVRDMPPGLLGQLRRTMRGNNM